MTPLSERQLQVAELVARGLTNKEIAREIGISPATVKMHVSIVIAKLGVGRRAAVGALLTGCVE